MTPVVEEPKSASFNRIVAQSAFLLALASVAFIIPGIVRTKFSALYFGNEGIALFGQLSQMQTVLISIGAAGLVTATRVVLSRPEHTPLRASRVLSWCIWVPFSGTLILAAIVFVFQGSISELLLGADEFGLEVALAGLGIPFAVAGQVSIAGAQARGSRVRLVVAALGSSVVGSGAVILLMSSQDQLVGSWSLVVGPAVQFIFVAAICGPVRAALTQRPWMNRFFFNEIFVIAWASALLAVCAALAELASRTLVLQSQGLASLAAYQPVATVVTQVVSLVLSALATASLVELSRVKDRPQIGRLIRELEKKFLPLIGLMSALLLAGSPPLIALFFRAELWAAAYPLMAIAVAFEPVRAAVWLAGSAFLPNGMRMAWLINGLITVLAQVLTVMALSAQVGVISLSIGFAVANTLSLIVTLSLLRKKGIRVGIFALVFPFLLAGLIMLASIWDQTLFGVVVMGPSACAVVISLSLLLVRYRGHFKTHKRRMT